MAVFIRLERENFGGNGGGFFKVVVRGSRGFRGNLLETIGVYRLFGSYKVFYIKKERLAYWLSRGALCSEKVLKELKKNGVSGR